MSPEFKKEILQELSMLINEQYKLLMDVHEPEFSKKPAPGRWSGKEILGHLIDSASNNIQRFIRGQYENETSIVYEQDTWVLLNGYQEAPLSELITLWYLMNRQIMRIIEKMPAENPGKIILINDQPRSLGWILEDYVRHMKHHLDQINGFPER
jgi:hypothetical protein